MVKYTYDNVGNVTKQMQSAEAPDAEAPEWRTVEYSYDCMNRVTDIAQTVNETSKVYTHYGYNASGLRDVKNVGGSTKYFIYNGINIVFEYEDSIDDGVVY